MQKIKKGGVFAEKRYSEKHFQFAKERESCCRVFFVFTLEVNKMLQVTPPRREGGSNKAKQKQIERNKELASGVPGTCSDGSQAKAKEAGFTAVCAAALAPHPAAASASSTKPSSTSTGSNKSFHVWIIQFLNPGCASFSSCAGAAGDVAALSVLRHRAGDFRSEHAWRTTLEPRRPTSCSAAAAAMTVC